MFHMYAVHTIGCSCHLPFYGHNNLAVILFPACNVRLVSSCTMQRGKVDLIESYSGM